MGNGRRVLYWSGLIFPLLGIEEYTVSQQLDLYEEAGEQTSVRILRTPLLPPMCYDNSVCLLSGYRALGTASLCRMQKRLEYNIHKADLLLLGIILLFFIYYTHTSIICLVFWFCSECQSHDYNIANVTETMGAAYSCTYVGKQ